MNIENMTNVQLSHEYCKCKDILLSRSIDDIWQQSYTLNMELSKEIMKRGGYIVVVNGGNILGKGVLG